MHLGMNREYNRTAPPPSNISTAAAREKAFPVKSIANANGVSRNRGSPDRKFIDPAVAFHNAGSVLQTVL
jgi:hypothetical protein